MWLSRIFSNVALRSNLILIISIAFTKSMSKIDQVHINNNLLLIVIYVSGYVYSFFFKVMIVAFDCIIIINSQQI